MQLSISHPRQLTKNVTVFLRIARRTPTSKDLLKELRKSARTLLFYPNIPGCVQLRRRWYMARRERPMVPAPSNTPMPDKQENAEAKSRLYSVYLRPWTLDKAIATSEVPHITDLDDLSNCHSCEGRNATGKSGGGTLDPPDKAEAVFPRRRLRSKQKGDVEETTSKRSYATAWSWYVRGHIVTEHAAKIIKQFMAACCGKTAKNAECPDDDGDGMGRSREMPDNTLPLARVHAILDRMSSAEAAKKPEKKIPKEQTAKNEGEKTDDDDAEDDKALRQSNAINDAMQMTARLWSRTAQPWPEETVERNTCSIGKKAEKQAQAEASQRKKRRKEKIKPKTIQAKAYMAWKEADVADWLAKLKKEKDPPNTKQMEFLLRVIDRCRNEATSFKSPQTQNFKDEPLRDCLLGLPGAGKSTCINLVRRFFEECLQWEDGIQFQFLATQNTMAALIGGATIHSWGAIPVNATDANSKVQTKNSEGDVDELFLKASGIRFIIIDEISTASPELLGLLDAYLRRACCRHPYACFNKHKRPFGGINIIFAGDFWQLTPVRSHAIFSNPFRKGIYSAVEQKCSRCSGT